MGRTGELRGFKICRMQRTDSRLSGVIEKLDAQADV